MPNEWTIITVRLHRQQLALLHQLAADQTHLRTKRERKHDHGPYKRSELIRHAITAGLDVLTDQPAIKL